MITHKYYLVIQHVLSTFVLFPFHIILWSQLRLWAVAIAGHILCYFCDISFHPTVNIDKKLFYRDLNQPQRISDFWFYAHMRLCELYLIIIDNYIIKYLILMASCQTYYYRYVLLFLLIIILISGRYDNIVHYIYYFYDFTVTVHV